MIEEIDCNPKRKDIPNGKQVFRIKSCRKNDSGLFILKLSYDNGEGEIAMFGNQMARLFRLCGFQETKKGVFAVDRDLMEGIEFEAEAYEEADKKSGKLYKRMKDYKKLDDEIPF